MSVAQKFYPKFFIYALRFDGVLSDAGTTECKIALYDENATFDVEHGEYSDVSSNILAGTGKSININVYRDGYRLYFEIPEVSWSSLQNEQFQHIIIWREAEKPGAILLMHLDLGSPQSPINGEFSLAPDENCIPNVDFSHEVCV